MVSYKAIRGTDSIACALRDAAATLDTDAAKGGLESAAVRRTSRPGGVEDGLWVGDLSTDVFEPVRHRRRRGGPWVELQSVEEAAARLRRFLAERPDLGVGG